MWNYSKKVMDHFMNPRNAGEMEDASAEGQVGSMACGDALKLMLKIDSESQRIVDARFLTFGCGSAVASASALTEMVIGKTLDEAASITDSDVAQFLDGLPAEKMHCSVMGTDALREAIANYRGEPIQLDPHDEVICECFGVTRGRIESICERHQVSTVDDITHFTKAAGSCGNCREKIGQILAEVAGTHANKAIGKACAASKDAGQGGDRDDLVQLSR